MKARILTILGAIAALLPLQGFAAIEADFNGDGSPEVASICNGNQICIRESNGNTHTYSNPYWTSLTLLQANDLDGAAGQELLVSAVENSTTATLVVIADASRDQHRYRQSHWTTYSLVDVTDTDGIAGKEVVLLVSSGTAPEFVVVSHASRAMRAYKQTTWNSLSYFASGSLVPGGGNELVGLATGGGGPAVIVIDDTHRNLNEYRDSLWNSIALDTIANTNGTGEKEVVLLYTAGSGAKGIGIVDPTGSAKRLYPFDGRSSIAITDVHDYQNDGNSEVCVLWTQGSISGRDIVDDRGKVIRAVTNCSDYASGGGGIDYTPPPTASIDSITGTRNIGSQLTFKGSGFTRRSGVTLSYHWQFGDGKTATGQTVTHAYSQAGTYTVRLKTYDGKNWSSEATASITIKDPSLPEMSWLHAEYTGCTGYGTNYALAWSASSSLPILEYDADMQSYGSSTWSSVYNGTGRGLNRTLYNKARFRVRARNANGWSAFAYTSWLQHHCSGGTGPIVP